LIIIVIVLVVLYVSVTRLFILAIEVYARCTCTRDNFEPEQQLDCSQIRCEHRKIVINL